MSVRIFESPISSHKILYGDDTDVTKVLFVKLGADTYVMHEYFTDVDPVEFSCKYVATRVLTKAEIIKFYELQVNSPMQYMTEETFERFINS